jgi:hypothetical protein
MAASSWGKALRVAVEDFGDSMDVRVWELAWEVWMAVGRPRLVAEDMYQEEVVACMLEVVASVPWLGHTSVVRWEGPFQEDKASVA